LILTSSDPTSWRGEGIPCSTAQVCQDGVCLCQSAFLSRESSCVASDTTHCGRRPTACEASQIGGNDSSQFVQPGAEAVGTSGGDAIVFENPGGSIVTVMYNSGSSATYIASVGGKQFQFSMPSNGWATVNYVP
jgi:Glycosyl hydrolase family 30 beta sandwich domain